MVDVVQRLATGMHGSANLDVDTEMKNFVNDETLLATGNVFWLKQCGKMRETKLILAIYFKHIIHENISLVQVILILSPLPYLGTLLGIGSV